MRGKWKNAPVTTKEDLAHMERVRHKPCICCMLHGIYRPSIVHHIKRGNKRMGHMFVLPLCPGHHVGRFIDKQDYGARLSVHRHHRSFVLEFGTEQHLWELTQISLGLPCNWPTSKIVSRQSLIEGNT